MKKVIRSAIFKWRQTEPELILCAVRWILRHSLSLRDAEELLSERGVEADHTAIWRWVQRYDSELAERLRCPLKPTNRSWRVDETYVRVKPLVPPLPSHRFHRSHDRLRALGVVRFRGGQTPVPQGVDGSVASANPRHQHRLGTPLRLGNFRSKKEGIPRRRYRHRPVQYLNNILEQNHRAIKRRVKANQGFREFHAAWSGTWHTLTNLPWAVLGLDRAKSMHTSSS